MVTFFVIIISVPPFLEHSISWMSGFLEVSRYSHAIYSSHIRSCHIILWIFKTSIIKISKFSKALLGPFSPNNHNFPSLCTTSEYFKAFFQRKTFWDQITDKIYGDSLKVMQVFCYDTANLYLYILHTGWFWKMKQWWQTMKAGKLVFRKWLRLQDISLIVIQNLMFAYSNLMFAEVKRKIVFYFVACYFS